MFQTYFSTRRMLHKETQGESRVRENRTHGLVYEAKAWLLNRASFTLVELLVVIAIIVMLASVLLPALSNAREMGRRIKCVSNLRQLGLAFSMYIQDNDGYFPHWRHVYNAEGVWSPSSDNYWMGALYVYFKNGGMVVMCPTKMTTSRYPVVKRGDFSNTYNTNYGYNYLHIGSSSSYSGTTVPAKLSQIRHHSETIVLADNYKVNDPVMGRKRLNDEFAASGSKGCLEARHNKSVNVLWADFHVSSCPVAVDASTCAGYSATDNPYLHDPFRNGTLVGDGANYFDRQ